HKTIHVQGLGESQLAERIAPWENQLPSFLKLAYLPSFGRVRLRLSASGSDQASLRTAIDQQVSALQTLISDHIVGYDESETLAFVVGRLLAESGGKLATAESCTGGALAKDLTSIPGASSYFLGGVVAYNAAVKTKELAVPQTLIAAHSVVSVEVAEAMALGVQQKFGSDYALATTGNAGPTTDNNDKEVGRVCIAVATPKGVVCGDFFFGKPREKVIERCVNKALEMLRMEILKNN
ncbi:MAG: nicotinamide-nucleotide amidohydrolase family protein, partial [Lutibacter sp.]|nr:nicotinamide-nucleotide amidohydrolase family protein [Lutibacter sp.]